MVQIKDATWMRVMKLMTELIEIRAMQYPPSIIVEAVELREDLNNAMKGYPDDGARKG